MATNDVTVYINHGKELGIVNEGALVYFADLENQGGYGGLKRVAQSAASSVGSWAAITLSDIHSAALSDGILGKYTTRRNKTYNYCKDLKWSNPSFTVRLDNEQIFRGNAVTITGTVNNGGTYPWLELYMDYEYVETTYNNEYGEYAFYLDSTQYSDGKHLLGVKLRNQDGFDYTSWYNIIINNTGSVFSRFYNI